MFLLSGLHGNEGAVGTPRKKRDRTIIGTYRKYPVPPSALLSSIYHTLDSMRKFMNTEVINDCKYAVVLDEGGFILKGLCRVYGPSHKQIIDVDPNTYLNACYCLWSNGFYGASSLTGGDLLTVDTERRAFKKLSAMDISDLEMSRLQSFEQYELSLEECMFLMAGLGIVQLYAQCKDNLYSRMTLEDVWERFVWRDSLKNSLQPKFFQETCNIIARCVSYYYYRSKGWIVKPGTKMGANWSLYVNGPVVEHSKYLVIVIPVFHQIHTYEMASQPSFTGSRVAREARIANNTAKELILCEVLADTSITLLDLRSPACMSNFSVCDMSMSRFCPEKSRS